MNGVGLHWMDSKEETNGRHTPIGFVFKNEFFMKNIALLLLLMGVFSISAVAQSHQVKTEQRTLKNSIKDKKEDKHAVGNNLRHLRVKSALKGRREVRRHRRSIRRQDERLERHGQNNPMNKAKRQAKDDKNDKKE